MTGAGTELSEDYAAVAERECAGEGRWRAAERFGNVFPTRTLIQTEDVHEYNTDERIKQFHSLVCPNALSRRQPDPPAVSVELGENWCCGGSFRAFGCC